MPGPLENPNIKKFYQQYPRPFNYVPNDLVSGYPTIPPMMSGLMRIDPNSGNIWISAGNTLVSDWKLITGGGGGGGTVSSVGLSMPSAFTVTNSPVTTLGTLTVTGAGTSSQYIDGTGALQTFPTIPTPNVYGVINGLTESPANTFKLGGLLIEDTSVTTQNDYAFSVYSPPNANPSLPAFAVVSTDGTAPMSRFFKYGGFESLVDFVKYDVGYVSGEPLVRLQKFGNIGDDVATFLELNKNGNSPGNGINTTYLMGATTPPYNVSGVMANQTVVITDASDADFQTNMEFYVAKGSVPTVTFPLRSSSIHKRMVIGGDGQITFNAYGLGNFNHTPAYNLGVDASGKVVEYNIPSSGFTRMVSTQGTFPVDSTWNDVTQLSFGLSPGKSYSFKAVISYSILDETDGGTIWIAVDNGSGSFSGSSYYCQVWDASGLKTYPSNEINTIPPIVTISTTTYNNRSNIAIVEGVISNVITQGNLQIQGLGKSGGAGGNTVTYYEGSSLTIYELP